MARIGLGLALTLGALAHPPETPAAVPKAQTIYHKSRAFRIPFHIDPVDRPRYKEVQLVVSSNGGSRWEPMATTQPDQPSFSFRAPRDGEYWFAVRMRDVQGRLIPGDQDPIEPSLKVIIDTAPPAISLDAKGRRGNLASVGWEIVEDHVDLKSFVLEYQAEGARGWSQVPVQKPARIDVVKWDAGTAEPIRVRAQVSDRAGNVKEASIALPGGAATRPASSADEGLDETEPPPIGTFTAREVERDEPPAMPSPTAPSPAPSRAPAPRASNFGGGGGGGGDFDPFATPDPNDSAPPSGGPGPPLVVASPKFSLKYEVDDPGPTGRPATVELWITRDGGLNWAIQGTDPDRVSPFPVELGEDGSYGLKLVALSSSELGDQRPTPGEAPMSLVEVDTRPPTIQIDSVQAGTDTNAGKVAIVWRASDPHPAPRPVVISARAATPNATWQPIAPAMENTGQYIWTVPPGFPPRFHIRIDVIDALGHRDHRDTTQSEPISVDRARPRGRITGLDVPGAIGSRPRARPFTERRN